MKYFFSLLFFIGFLQISAQEIKKTQDLGLWVGFEFKYDIHEKFRLSLLQDLRLQESISEFDKYISDLGVDYRINKHFKLAGNVRYFLNRKKDKTISQNYRYNLDLKYKTSWFSEFRVKYRLRFQSNYEELFAVVDEGVESNLRNELTLQYRLNEQHQLYFSSEIFREITAFREPYFNQARFFIGDQFQTKFGEFELAAGYERELESKRPLNLMLIKLRYSLSINNDE